MAQSKIKDFANMFGKGGGGGKGLSIGVKLLVAGGALVYGATQSVFLPLKVVIEL